MDRRAFWIYGLPIVVAALVVAAPVGMFAWTIMSRPQLIREPGQEHPIERFASERFASVEGKTGWKANLVGRGMPLATPAVVGDKVFLGGGFATTQFFALDAATGKNLWTHQTSDIGPTAAVVEDGHIVYNTESCELEVITTAGETVWKKWLGDPLMTVPTVGGGRVFTSYPKIFGGGNYCLACFELRTGAVIWETPIESEIITSATLDKNRLYFATLDGTLACVNAGNGVSLWKEKVDAVSSPQIVGERCYFQRRILDQKKPGESLAWRGLDAKGTVADVAGTMRDLKTIESSPQNRENDALYYSSLDSSAGWSGNMSNAAGVGRTDALKDAKKNLGLSTVSEVWSFQGSRPFLYEGRLYRAIGDSLQCVDPVRGEVVWTKELPAGGALTAPSLVNGKAFVGGTAGTLFCISTRDGNVLWQATIGEAISAQVAVAQGRVFVPTRAGTLYCIETGDANDHGWSTWAANAAHR